MASTSQYGRVHAGGTFTPDRYKDNPACLAMSYFLIELLEETGTAVNYFPNVLMDRTANTDGEIINGLTRNNWESQLDELVAAEAFCGLSIESAITGDSLAGTIRYALTEPHYGTAAITVYLIENDLDGSAQADADADYRHNAVLRGLMTAKEGRTIDATTTAQVLEFKFNTINISEFKTQDLEIVAFIHKTGAGRLNKKILNGQKVKAGLTQYFD